MEKHKTLTEKSSNQSNNNHLVRSSIKQTAQMTGQALAVGAVLLLGSGTIFQERPMLVLLL